MTVFIAVKKNRNLNPAISILSSNHITYNVISVAISSFFKITLIRKGNSFQKIVTFFVTFFIKTSAWLVGIGCTSCFIKKRH